MIVLRTNVTDFGQIRDLFVQITINYDRNGIFYVQSDLILIQTRKSDKSWSK